MVLRSVKTDGRIHCLLPLVATLAIAASCKSRSNNEATPRGQESQPASLIPSGAGLGEAGEVKEPDEDANIAKMLELGSKLQEGIRKRQGKPGQPLQRDVHTKSHGCARGVFEVDPQLHQDFNTGVFQAGARYPVWIRLSNGVPGNTPDSSPSSRGFAIKLLDVEKQIAATNRTLPPEEAEWLMAARKSFGQDFTFLNHRQFIIRDLKTYVEFTKGVVVGNPIPAFVSLNPKDPQFKPVQGKTFVETVLMPVSNPVEISYFGQVPFKFKTTAAKWRLDRCEQPSKKQDRAPSAPVDSLYRAFTRTLDEGDVCYDFSVILQKDAKVQPIEDSNIEWLSDDDDVRAGRKFANRTRVARLILPRQKVDNPEVDARCEAMSFNPWHALAAHKPLGSMGRARKAIYLTGASARTTPNEGSPVDDEHKAMLERPSAFEGASRPTQP